MEEVFGVRNVVISVGNALLSEAIAGALRRSGQFRCQRVPPERAREIPGLCRDCRCGVLLMDVSRLPGATLVAVSRQGLFLPPLLLLLPRFLGDTGLVLAQSAADVLALLL